MPKDFLNDYSATAGSNTDVGGINIDEGCAPSTLNDAIREVMSHLAGLSAELDVGADIASATALPVNVAGMMHDVTGTTTITSFAEATNDTSRIKVLQFDGALTLTHHATDLVLLTGANRTTTAGDIGIYYQYAAGDWREVYFSASSSAVTTRGDIIRGDSSGNAERLALGNAGEVLVSDGTDISYGVANEYGLLPSNDTDADHDINFTAGRFVDDTNAVMMTLSSEITKQADATWSVGDDAGGMVTSESLPTSGTVHCWLIMKADGTVDICFNNHASSGLSPTLPTDYIYKRRIASFRTDSSANIYGFTANLITPYEVEILYDDLKSSTLTSSATAQLRTMTVPLGIKVLLIATWGLRTGSTAQALLVTSPDQTDVAPTINNPFSVSNAGSTGASLQYSGAEVRTRTNTSGQVRDRASQSSNNEFVNEFGYIDSRV